MASKHPKCTINCPKIDANTADENTDGDGLTRDNIGTGFAKLKKKNKPAVTKPIAVICISPCFKPRKYKSTRKI